MKNENLEEIYFFGELTKFRYSDVVSFSPETYVINMENGKPIELDGIESLNIFIKGLIRYEEHIASLNRPMDFENVFTVFSDKIKSIVTDDLSNIKLNLSDIESKQKDYVSEFKRKTEKVLDDITNSIDTNEFNKKIDKMNNITKAFGDLLND